MLNTTNKIYSIRNFGKQGNLKTFDLYVNYDR
jgi:hypothetical protein